ncbi:MAG: polyribonucleotide nucleotidyltransferase [Candidatus Delongbacteria bacterium]|nr:polyribonucleotide nucleotidyltransferase [Candidatus Cloacimonadota bacterium]MCB9473047.1 polyribonucleotide nucleotidyltransferase [Candidatus Delongbacteria bacterium]
MIEKSIQLDGRTLTMQVGKVAKQAHGACWIRLEDTIVLATSCAQESARPGQEFFPLSVEYKEKQYAAGRIPGGYFKREARPSDRETLACRLIDRPLRPLFADGYMNETQIMADVISYDGATHPGPLACTAASLALCSSVIPFETPIASVTIGRIDGQLILFPTQAQEALSDIEVVVAATKKDIAMVEGEAREINESELLEIIRFAHEKIRLIIELQESILAELPKPVKWEVALPEINEELKAAVTTEVDKDIAAICEIADKTARRVAVKALKERVLAIWAEQPELQAEVAGLTGEVIHDRMKDVMRANILDKGRRLDGRETTTIRQITCEVDLLPRAHGSALFTRGQTQALGAVTLGTKKDQQRLDGIFGDTTRNFLLHYNFPPFSVGEVKRPGTSRREIGHGNLAERALKHLIDKENFPYTIRYVSEILESNGSSSMATVCAGSMAMMAAGVPMTKPAAGIAMGLIKDGDKVAVLSDILGDEDHLGDMDFKVCGTKDGITAFQMDIKIDGLSYEIMEKALHQARDGRMHILGKMAEAISETRKELSMYAPRLEYVMIPVDKIGMVIGPGGKMIREITEATGTTIDIENDGKVTVASDNGEALARALDWIRSLVAEPEVGATYEGKVVGIQTFGAFVEIMPGREGLLHISQIDWGRTERVEDVLKVGDKIQVLLQEAEHGKLSLSRRALLPRPEGYVDAPERDRRPSGDRPPRPGGDRPRGGGDRGGPRGGGDRGGRR